MEFELIFLISESKFFSSVQLSHSVVSDSATPQTASRQASLSITNSRSSPKPMSIELVMPSSHGGSEKPGKLEVGGASRDSTGLGALEEGLISS